MKMLAGAKVEKGMRVHERGLTESLGVARHHREGRGGREEGRAKRRLGWRDMALSPNLPK